MHDSWDVAIVGGGILGTSVAYWLANQYEGRIAVLEKEAQVAVHTSYRNTGVVHRPFYLDPKARRVFARSAQTAYGMWKKYAAERGLPWSPVGTLEVATKPEQSSRLERYYHWGLENGMTERELELLSSEDVRKLEPHVRSLGAVWSKTDTGVDYRAFTRSLRADAEAEGVKFLLDSDVKSVTVGPDHLMINLSHAKEPVKATFLINCAGGNSVKIAHMLGVGREYADLNFRGEYWEIGKDWVNLATRNIYTVAKHPELPFLDPHWIVRADGRREIGPNAVPVPGPYTYHGLFDDPAEAVQKLFERPVGNKLAALVNPDFLTLATEEWASSISKRAMAKRVQEFLPALRVKYLTRPGTAGVRAQVVDPHGNFVKEAIEIPGPHSFHVVNYNSPGATGSPAYTAWIVQLLAKAGHLDHLKAKAAKPAGLWDFDAVCAAIEAPSVSA